MHATSAPRLDATDYAIISQALIAAAREMGMKLIRSAYSAILREARDGATALLDRSGNVIAQSELIPMHLGTMGDVIRPCLEIYPVDTLEDGDFLISNDPYRGGQHLNDIFIFSPIFFDGRVVAFAGACAHHLDIGGVGETRIGLDLYSEGLRLPPLKFNIDRDWNGGALERLIGANVRVSDQILGDLNAQFAANAVGVMRVGALCAKYGVESIVQTMSDLLDYSEQRIRAAISQIRDGVYEGEDFIDGENGELLPIRVKVTVKGDTLHMDFTGTHPQAAHNINAPFASTYTAAFSCAKMVLTSADIPLNEGMKRPFEVTAPLGSILNPRMPAAVRARMVPTNRAFSAVMKALSKVAPDRVVAGGGDTTTCWSVSYNDGETLSLMVEPIGCGRGAAPVRDGVDAVAVALGNCANTPIEVIDASYKFFEMTGYSLLPDAFGAGRYRGGAAFCRQLDILEDGVEFSIYADHFVEGPAGLNGGKPGTPGYCRIFRGNEVIELPATATFVLKKGDRVEVGTSGGGGYGDPRERDMALVEADIRNGMVT